MRACALILALSWLCGPARAAEVAITPATRALIEPVFQTYAAIDAAFAALPPPASTREHLLRLGRLDQEPRSVYGKIPFANVSDEQRAAAFKAVYAEINRRDAENLAQLKKLLPPEGWFRTSQYGAEAAEAAWHIVQHAFNMNPEFMPVVLARMEKLLPASEVDGQSYAMLFDRVALLQGRLQRYGTQRICVAHKWTVYPMENAQGVEALRKTMDFRVTFAEEMAEVAKAAPCPSNYDKPLPKAP